VADKIVKGDAEWRSQLSEQQYAVTRQQETERPFTGIYHDSKEPGTYSCVCCGSRLFRSETKFDSGTGWPSFFEPIDPTALTTREDLSHGMQRIEVICSHCDAHLGHLFPDGPTPTGQRYCMNSTALLLDPDE
jgi:peptide-methionine (R)-S-oxide reductase